MQFELDHATTPEPLGDGSYEVDLTPGWVVGGGLNGGYLLAVVARAIGVELDPVGRSEPISMSAYFLSPSVPGPARVRVRPVRQGGRRSTVAASLVQQRDGADVERITVLATYGPLENEPQVLRQLPVPELPELEECVPTLAAPEEVRKVAPLMERFDLRLDPAYAGWAVGEPSRSGVVQGRFRFADDRPLDPVSLLVVLDALPPVTFDLGMPGWAPTLELTAHLRARPAPGWAVVRHETRNVSGGYFEEDCGVWDATGRLVAQSRQLALQPRPPG